MTDLVGGPPGLGPVPGVATAEDARRALRAVQQVTVVHRAGGWWQLASVVGFVVSLLLWGWMAWAWATGPMEGITTPHFLLLTGALGLSNGAAWLESSALVRARPRWEAGRVPSPARRALLRLVPPLGLRMEAPAGPGAWPPGTEELALLAVAARTRGIAPDWLYDRAGMSWEVGDSWLAPMVRTGLLTGGVRSWRAGHGLVTVTEDGRERLAEILAGLEALAAR